MEFHSEKIYKPSEIVEMIKSVRKDFRIVKTKYGEKYFNVPFAFDIETSNFYRDGEKQSCMYAWGLGIMGAVMIGRTWTEFRYVISEIARILKTDKKKHVVIYVHNLAYDFQFFRKHLNWIKVFAIDSRKPVYAMDANGILFKCSYILTGLSLKKTGENLVKHDMKKLTGELDYQLTRHSATKLTTKEQRYLVRDCNVVMALIDEKIETDGNIFKIPMTKTGYVRNYVRKECFYGDTKGTERKGRYLSYRDVLKPLELDSELYKMLKRAFMGGFTHANAFCAGKTMEKVCSYDIASSYPTVMVADFFPMSSPQKITIKSKTDFTENLKRYCCLFDCKFKNLRPKLWQDMPLSESRCRNVKGKVTNNGRIVKADSLITTITEQDFYILNDFYAWDSLKIGTFYRFEKGYLPTPFVRCALELYAQKTQLKGNKEKEAEYNRAKEMVNSMYGMMVTDPLQEENVYYCHENRWQEEDEKETVEEEKRLQKYNNSPSRFLYYAWGVWVTAHARRNLFRLVKQLGNDYVYADTDAAKFLNEEKHAGFIERYNRAITKKLKRALEWHKLDEQLCEPKNEQNGKTYPLGHFTLDGRYSRFKTLGAKRYMVEYADTGEVNITVSGINKEKCVPYLETKEDPFEFFKDGMVIPPDYTGKLTMTYLDEGCAGTVTDYNGINGSYAELSCVHSENARYQMSLSEEYSKYLLGLFLD